MTLKLYFHPLSSFCHKALIALYEHGTPFEPVIVDLGDPASRASFAAVWPLAKFPALRDDARGHTVAESSAVIEYIDTFHRGDGAVLIPGDRDAAWQTRMWDQFFDNYVQVPMQKVNGDHFRPDGGHDPVGVEQAQALLIQAYDIVEQNLRGPWMLGDAFTLADCAAAPALFYADLVAPIPASAPRVSAYLDRLMARPSYARALVEAEPYFPMYPGTPKPSRSRARA